jgi:hypothetical protein
VSGQRKYPFAFPVVLLGLSLTALAGGMAWARAPDIILPDPLAVELPDGTSDLSVDDAPLRILTQAVKAEGQRVTLTLPRDRIGVGVWRVVWSAWDGSSNSHPISRRSAFLFVLPHGMTAVGSSGGANAIAGNNTAHIARDSAGSVHMVWYDSWRANIREGAQYRRARTLPDGSVQFETDVVPLGEHAGIWSAMPTLAVVGNTVHFAWQAEGTIRYRSLTRDGAAWRWSDEIDTKVPSPGRDTGPSIAANGTAVHILSPSAIYASSTDGGRTWTTEPVPFGTDQHVKTVSLALDAAGFPLAAASSVVTDVPKLSEDQGHGGYWTIRLARRVSAGKWERVPGPVDIRPEWGPPGDLTQDVLCDWVRVLEDKDGGIHMTWHGTAISRIYGNDRGYYAWRSPDGVWRSPVSLREPDPRRGYGWSYAPGLTLDRDRALTLTFHDVRAGKREAGFDSDLDLLQGGRPVLPRLPVTRFAENSIVSGQPENALSAWFPGAAPDLVRGADGRIWADILLSLAPVSIPANTLIVWYRLDLTEWMKSAGQ